MEEGKITVLVVEDSPVVQLLLVHLLNGDPQIHVIGTANDGEKAVEFITQKKPDVILMDIHLPKMDGFEATRRIMETQPVPIIISSASTKADEIAMTFGAMEAGAVAFVDKPVGVGHPDFDGKVRKLIQTVKLMAEVKVVRRWSRSRRVEAVLPAPLTAESLRAPGDIKLVAIGASTGGPIVLQTILAGLRKDFPAPVLIVQHIAAGFLQGLADWLVQTTGFPTHIATHGEQLRPSHAYLAPDGFHMGVGSASRIVLSKEEPENGLRPSVAHLFRSVAKTGGANTVGVLLTGMGKDGAEELCLLKQQGAITIAQDKESSVIYGMPGEAVRLDAAMYVLPPERIAATLASLVKGR